EPTDEDVRRAIERGKEYLLNLRNPDGSFTSDPKWRSCYSAIILMTLARLGEHPNREVMSAGLNYLTSLNADRDFNDKQGYALPIRIMALAYVHNRCTAARQASIRQKMREDIARVIAGQSGIGGWRYKLDRGDYDYSATQWPLLAMYEAGRVGIEFPPDAFRLAKSFYFRGQHDDGGWGYQLGGQSYGSMTAAGLASLYIMADRNPACDWKVSFNHVYYWLYSVERVGIAAGYKYFGQSNWYKDGVRFLLDRQRADGSWAEYDQAIPVGVGNWGGGRVPDTCFALLFLYKGRAPVLFNKLRFEGTWNAHRRDVANLTAYIERNKEQMFNWQIVDLAAPLDELHDAPVLYITAESLPRFSAKDKAQLRAFTDTGGTILFEASCGNPAVRKWFQDFAKEVWPEWPLAPLGPTHAVFTDPYPLAQRPELLGIHDGLRTILFFALDDVSCSWQTRAYLSKEYLFQWGINVFTYAMDHGALRAKLAGREPLPSDRYQELIRPGPKKTLKMARLEHSGNWAVGCNYAVFQKLAAYTKGSFDVTLEVKQPQQPPFNTGGVAAGNLQGFDIAYLTSSGAFALSDAERTSLKEFVGKGGFLWAQAAAGSPAAEDSVKALAKDCGWDLKPLSKNHPMMTGRMGAAQGHDLTQGVEFRHALRLLRTGKPWAELVGIFSGAKLVGVFSPFDLEFSLSPYEAYECRGYKPADAGAVALNILLYQTAAGQLEETAEPPPKVTRPLLVPGTSAPAQDRPAPPPDRMPPEGDGGGSFLDFLKRTPKSQ
ncbi:MAG: DUF4159 domain-containing protein, partial [Planctomycetota bacterium]|nr:DUF4159 domain-containing protein [Planctomycetota bacterium]